MTWINKDTDVYCSFAKSAGNTGCQMMNSAFYYYGLNKVYKSFSVANIEDAVAAVKTLGIKGFAITMPYKIEVLKFVDERDSTVCDTDTCNTVINENGKLKAYNTDLYSSTEYLKEYDNEKKIYILGNGGYSRSVKKAAEINEFDIQQITRSNWSDIGDIRDSVVFNCTPVDVVSMVDKSNDFIDSSVQTITGKTLASLQASKQFELYTNLPFPFGIDPKKAYPQ